LNAASGRSGCDVAERFVGFGDDAFQISSGIDELVFRELSFGVCDRLISTHFSLALKIIQVNGELMTIC